MQRLAVRPYEPTNLFPSCSHTTLSDVVNWAMSTVGKTSPDVSSATAAFAVAVAGNSWGRITGHAAIVPILGTQDCERCSG